ncbi:MAG TPA: cobalamin-independent methionine synthase II family protein [Xanthobacteraceae bacterium]|jgi:5-methyltetrahydropteroyltriglutamate--homocysteine methyltransferase|nr:cobalamin-independent methionine synthase II family protein [Xanthobacteraceae bacterium]
MPGETPVRSSFEALATTSVGSFPRPAWLADTARSEATFRMTGAPLKEALDDATIVVLREQEELGLDILTDGEMRRTHFIFHVAGAWDGIDTRNLVNKEIYRNRAANRMVPRITGKITRRAAASVEDLHVARSHTRLPLKMAVPGPMTVTDSAANEFYDSEEELALDAAAAINGELRDLQAAGCDVLQIDEPAMTRYHDKVVAYGARALDRCLEGITVPTVVHLCYGYPGGGYRQHQYEYKDLLPHLMETRIGGFTVEFGRSSFDPHVLKMCGSRFVMFGCVDPGDTPAPTVETIERRVGEVLEVLDPKQVWLAPDCGLMTISRTLAQEKLRVMVEAARRLRARL